MNLFSRMALLGATALVAVSMLATGTEPAVASDGTLVKSGAVPQLGQRADHPSFLKKPKKQKAKKK